MLSVLPCRMQMAAFKSQSHTGDNSVKLTLWTAEGDKVH